MKIMAESMDLLTAMQTSSPKASVVHTSSTRQMQANPPVVGQGFPLGSPPER